MHAFRGNESLTIGVEEEFHLVDAHSAELAPRVEALLACLDPSVRERMDHELFLCVLERKSDVFSVVGDLVDSIVEGRNHLASVAAPLGLRLVAAGSHPFADWKEMKFVDSPHYRWVQASCGYAANRMLAFGFHVHVGVRSAEAALYVINQMKRWVYPLLAFSVNSPFHMGRSSGLQSTRMDLFNSLPRTLLPPVFRTWPELGVYYDKLLETGHVTRPQDLWWSLRPQPVLGTVEFRVFDLPTSVERLGCLAALAQAGVGMAQDEFLQGQPWQEMRPEYLSQNRWEAMHNGLNGKMIDACTGEVLATRTMLAQYMQRIRPKARQLGALGWLDRAKTLLSEPTEAEGQLSLAAKLDDDLCAMELELAHRTCAGLCHTTNHTGGMK